MSSAYHELAERIRGEVLDLDRNLDEFQRFRHLVRNVYILNLVPQRMTGLVSALPELWSRERAELLAFAAFLDALAGTSQPASLPGR
jgi:HepT-like protein